VKSVHYQRTGRPIIGRSIHTLLKAFNRREGVTAELLELAGLLDQY
jgi:hypothetical protein